MQLFEQISAILTQPYGSMAYHLVISFIFIGALYPALVFSSEEKRPRRRTLLGISGLLLTQLLIFITSAFLLFGITGLQTVLPVLDRVMTEIDVVIIIWLFGFVRSEKRLTDLLFISAIIFILVAGFFTVMTWTNTGEAGNFILSNAAFSWNIASAILCILGEALIFGSKSRTRSWGLTMLGAIFLGELVNILVIMPGGGDYSVFLRLTYLISFPLLYGVSGTLQAQVTHTKMIVTSIPDNFPVTTKDSKAEVHEEGDQEYQFELAEPFKGIELHLFQNAMALAASTSAQETYHLFTRFTAHAMVSDICLLLSPPDEDGEIHLISAYDLIVQEIFSPLSFEQDLIPGYAEALKKGEILQVSDETSSKISAFAHLIMVDRINSMVVYPLIGSDGECLAAVCLVSPYSNHRWTKEEHKYLIETGPAMVAVLERANTPPGSSPAMERLTRKYEESEKERLRLTEEVDTLSGELTASSILTEIIEPSDTSGSGRQDQLAPLQASIEALEMENEHLKSYITELEASSSQSRQAAEGQSEVSSEALDELSAKLQEALKRAGNFENQLRQAKAQLDFYSQQEEIPANGNTIPTEQAEVIASIAQELRQPMSSISGYTDLLISESVGILGALQKKFLERVKASVDRMNHLIGDLIQITTMESGSMELTTQSVEIAEIVDTAIETTSGQFREKNIALRVDISPDLPSMHTDRDAIQQILLHLLQNAGSATPNEGEIHVKIEPYNSTDSDIILIAVTDSGEGIPKEDLSRVFSRLYRADNPLIPGVGDTGVGLSIAKTLAEALGGRIWVESTQGVGSTFSVLLPTSSQAVSSPEG